MNDSPRPRPARRLALLAVLAIAFVIGIFALLDEPTEVASNRTPQSEEPEVAASTARDEVELASAPVVAPSAAPTEAESVRADADSEPAAAAATLASNNRAAVSEAHGVARWSDLLAPYDAHDNTHVADARISIVLADGQLVTASLSDPVDPRALVEGNVGVLDAPNHFSRLFLPHELADVSTAHAVSLQPAATLLLVPDNGATFLPEGASIVLFFEGAPAERLDEAEPVSEPESSVAPELDDSALSSIANYGDRLTDSTRAARQRARHARWILAREWARPLFDLERPTVLAFERYWRKSIDAQTDRVALRIPAHRAAGIALEPPDDSDLIWCISAAPLTSSVTLVDHDFVATDLAAGDVATLVVYSHASATVIGQFPANASNWKATLEDHTSDGDHQWRLDVSDDGRFERNRLTPGSYSISSNWIGAEDVHVSAKVDFDLVAGQMVDLGTLAPEASSKPVTITPVLRVDGVVVSEDLPCTFEVHIQRVDRTSVSSRRIVERSNLREFACEGLEPALYELDIRDLQFTGDAAKRYLWVGDPHQVQFNLADTSITVELVVNVRSAGLCTLALHGPAISERTYFRLDTSFIDEAGNRLRGVGTLSTSTEPRDGLFTFERLCDLPPGRYDVWVVVEVESVTESARSADQSFVGHVDLMVNGGSPSRADVALQEATTLRGSFSDLVGERSADTWIRVHPTARPQVFLQSWISRPDEDAGEGHFVVRGLLPHTEYEVARFGQRFTTGAPGSTTEL